MTEIRSRLVKTLWPDNGSTRASVWTILDAARDSRIFSAVDRSYLEKCCLYAGDLPWQLQMASPYLVELRPDDRLTDMVIDHGWGRAWGIYFRSETGMNNLRRHFRGFLRVRDRQGRRLIFRYYDPRVMRIYLPTCTPEELRTVFGPVREFLVESEDASAVIQYGFDGKQLWDRRFRLSAAG